MSRIFRTLFLALVLSACALPAFAQNTSTTQMQLVNSSVFTGRLQYLLAQQALQVLAETHNCAAGCAASKIGNTGQTFTATYDTTCHTARVAHAVAVVQSPATMASVDAVLVAGGNFAGGVIIGTVTGSGSTADSTASDTAIATAIANLWNTLSKCDTGA